ncbi:pancreatic triacylglycerol lipase-like [Adelges cooleyi]|uniref:pancreatic triacylglycerol lipase-like n=1 Tax=Adelges cooleyi TaxID=133065 RepID=UPI0021802A3E|nr:pancreatic triacylglycerol lipase-like [Adelges cooleyi]
MNFTRSNLIVIFLALTVSSISGCRQRTENAICESLPSNKNGTKFYLYTKKSSVELTVDEDSISAAPFADSNKLIFYLHGFGESADAAGALLIRNAYLNGTDDVNVVLVDYSNMTGVFSPSLYGFALSFPRSRYCYLPRTADTLVEMILLIQKVNTQINYTRLIGFSLGAQIAGKAGTRYKEITGWLLDRITALDAGGTCLQQSPEISKHSASFVDVVHSNTGWFGYIKPAGHVDFYMNNGIIQPVCLTNASDVADIFGFPSESMDATLCSHLSSVLYFVASIYNDEIYAQCCKQIRRLTENTENHYLLDDDNNNAISLTCNSSNGTKQIVFGEHAPLDASGTYYATIPNILELISAIN